MHEGDVQQPSERWPLVERLAAAYPHTAALHHEHNRARDDGLDGPGPSSRQINLLAHCDFIVCTHMSCLVVQHDLCKLIHVACVQVDELKVERFESGATAWRRSGGLSLVPRK